jgi:hypothetical protein
VPFLHIADSFDSPCVLWPPPVPMLPFMLLLHFSPLASITRAPDFPVPPENGGSRLEPGEGSFVVFGTCA